MSRLIENLMMLAPKEGYNPSFLPGVGIYKASHSSDRIPLCYNQGVIIVAQGHKRIYLDQDTYDYNPDNYLVLTLPLPAECETIVEPGKPLLSMMIDINLAVLNELVRHFDEHQQIKESINFSDTKGLYISDCNKLLIDTVTRLAQCLNSPLETDILGKGLMREVLFHLLQGDNAAPLFSLVSHNTHLARMERVLKHLHEHYGDQLDVEQLANMANMSISSFHRNFRQVTSSSPIQYIKKLRLNRAKELLLDQGLKIKQAAAQVWL